MLKGAVLVVLGRAPRSCEALTAATLHDFWPGRIKNMRWRLARPKAGCSRCTAVVDADLFRPDRRLTRSATRHELGIPLGVHVVLIIAAREHKRINHLIHKTARYRPRTWHIVYDQRSRGHPFVTRPDQRWISG